MSQMTPAQPKFDPAAMGRQIDSFLSAIPKDQHFALVFKGSLADKRGDAALVGQYGKHFAGFVRGGYQAGAGFDAEVGGRVSFLFGTDRHGQAKAQADPLSRAEMIGVLMHLGNSRLRAAIKVAAIRWGVDVYADPARWFA